MENSNVQKQKYCIEIADVPLTILSDESEEFVQDTVRLLDTQIRDLTVHNKRCAKIDAAILCALDSLGEKLKLEKKLRNLQAQIDLYEANLRRLRTESTAVPAPAEETPAVPEKPAEPKTKPEKAEKPKKAEEKAAPKAKKPAVKPAAQQLSVEETAAAPAAEEPKEKATAPVEEPKTGVRDDKLKQIESLLRRRSEAAPEQAAADGATSSHDDKLREIEELLRVGGGRSLSEALKDARES